MEFKGVSAYDETDFFTKYMERRNRPDGPNNAIEKPIIEELLGNVCDLTILDLGCGDASFGKDLLQKGASRYEGVEGAQQMIELAETNLSSLNGIVHKETMESFAFYKDSFDLITSRFAVHYVENIDTLFQKIYTALKEKGRFVFSVQHPLTTSSFESKKDGEKRGSWIVDDYFVDGVRKEPWMDKVVVKYHRTIEQYFTALTKSGFQIEDLREGTPEPQYFSSDEEYIRRKRIPIVLIFSCTKR